MPAAAHTTDDAGDQQDRAEVKPTSPEHTGKRQLECGPSPDQPTKCARSTESGSVAGHGMAVPTRGAVETLTVTSDVQERLSSRDVTMPDHTADMAIDALDPAPQPTSNVTEQLAQQLVETGAAMAGMARIKAKFLRTKEDLQADKAARISAEEEAAKQKVANGEDAGDDKKRGFNKKRPRDSAPAKADRLCLAIARQQTCSYGDSCRFNHDKAAFLADRPEDIGPRCYLYDVRGICPAGLLCRWGGAHIDLDGMASFSRPVEQGGLVDEVKELNVLSKDIMNTCRKNKYPFACERKEFKKYLENLMLQGDRGEADGLVSEAMEPKEAQAQPQNGHIKPPGEPPAAVERPTGVLPEKERRPIDFSGKVYVAPLTTVGNLPYRRVLKDLGTDITCGEMALAPNLLKGQASEWALLRRHPCEDIFGVQLAGAHGDQMARCGELLERHTDVDFVDLNLGCPIDMVCNRGMGSALMGRQRKVRSVFTGLGATFSGSITIKMRIGWDEKKPVAHKLVRYIQEHSEKNKIAAVMIHGRSRLQRYSRLADWEYIHQCARSQNPDLRPIPVIGNGDIMSFTDWEEHKARGGLLDCCMLARGALIKPWLPREIKEQRHWDISSGERLDIIRNFVNYGLEHWGCDQMGVNNTRRFLLEWLSFSCRYIPVGLLEVVPQRINERPLPFFGRNDLETLMASNNAKDWIKLSELVLGPVPEDFKFEAKHKANSYAPTANIGDLGTEGRGPPNVEG